MTRKNHFYKLRASYKESFIEPKSGYCINCENKHGCKSKTPPCIVEMMEENVTGMSGKQYLINQKKTVNCRDCSFFRSCWNTEEYDRFASD